METFVQSRERLVLPVVCLPPSCSMHWLLRTAKYVQQLEREWTTPTLRLEWIPWCDMADVPTLDSVCMDHAIWLPMVLYRLWRVQKHLHASILTQLIERRFAIVADNRKAVPGRVQTIVLTCFMFSGWTFAVLVNNGRLNYGQSMAGVTDLNKNTGARLKQVNPGFSPFHQTLKSSPSIRTRFPSAVRRLIYLFDMEGSDSA